MYGWSYGVNFTAAKIKLMLDLIDERVRHDIKQTSLNKIKNSLKSMSREDILIGSIMMLTIVALAKIIIKR